MSIQTRTGSISQLGSPSYVSPPLQFANPPPEFDLPYRTQRTAGSAASSYIEDVPTDGISDNIDVITTTPAPHRSRSFSISNSNRSRSSSPASAYCESPMEPTKWQGCQSFFCPQYRAVGDQRQRCASVLRECTSCSVHVCEECIEANPPCNCTFCEVNYLCPNCLRIRERDGTCRRVDEERERREQQWKRDMQMLEGIVETKIANEVAEFAGQFFDAVEQPGIMVEEVEDVSQNAHASSSAYHGNHRNASGTELFLEDIFTDSTE